MRLEDQPCLREVFIWSKNISLFFSESTARGRGVGREACLSMMKYGKCLKDRVPTPQGKQGKWQQKFRQGKHRKFRNFAKTQEKTQGIWFAQVVNSLILKVKDVSIFAAKICIFSEAAVLCM